jgi:hypothetical protein
MTASLPSKLLRLLLSVTIVFTPYAYAAPQTQTGGGGGTPPNLPPPPVDYGGGSGGGPTEPSRQNPRGQNPAPRVGKFMEVYSISADGRQVYYEGQLDDNNRNRVFKHSSPDRNFITRGVIIPDASHPDGSRVNWLRGGSTMEILNKELAARVNPVPETARADVTISERPPTRYLLDPIRVTDVRGATESAYFQGRQDSFKRDMIFRPVQSQGQANILYYHTGVIEADGRATWSTDYTNWEKLLKELNEANYGKKEKTEQTERIKKLRERAYAEDLIRSSRNTQFEVRQVSPNSNYPELPRPAEPIPQNRALVPAGEVQNQPVRPNPGHSGVNSPGTEYFPEMDSRYKPSRLRRSVRLTADNVEFIRQEIAKLNRGKPNALAGSSPAATAADLTENKRAPNYDLPRGVAGFYIAMGLIAGVTLYTDYANNPAAWTSYISSSTDPMGIAHLAAFMAIAGGSYWAMARMSEKMLGPGAMQKGYVHRPVAVGTIAIAGLLSTVLVEIMADPNTAKCLGTSDITASLKETRPLRRDYQACDALWDRWSSNSHWNNMAVNQLVPMFANMVVAGTMWQTTLVGTNWLMSRQAVAVSLRSMRFGFSANGGWFVKLLGATANVAIFLGAYHVSDKIFGVGQWAREAMIDDWSFSNDPHGASLRESEDLLLREWAMLKANKFKNPDSWAKVCFDSGRKYSMFFNCDEPNRLTLEGLLNKYGDFQQQWRKSKLTDTENAYKQWRLKSDEYYAMLEISHDFYGSVLDDPSKLGPEFIADFVKRQNGANQDSWKLIKDINPDGQWKYLTTYKITDHLVASMACGPEAEGYGQGEGAGLFGKIGSFWTGWVSGNTTPGQVLDNGKGWKVVFHPPRLTHPLRRGESNVCQSGGFSRMLPLGTPTRVHPGIFPSSTDNGRYNNLFEYIRAEIRPGLTGMADAEHSHFSNWWEKHITPPSNAVDAQLRKDYEHLLNNEYSKALSEKTNRRCYPSKVRTTGLEKYLKQMGRSDDSCPPEALDRLSHGVLLGLRDEARLYLAMLTDLQMSNLTALGSHVGLSSTADKEKILIDRANRMLSLMERLLDGAKIVDPAKRIDLKSIAEEWVTLSTINKVGALRPQALRTAAQVNPELESLRVRLRAKMDQILAAPEADRALMRAEMQTIQREVERVEKAQPRDHGNVLYDQQKHLEDWGFLLGTKLDGAFSQALNLYKILTLFEQP